MAKDPVRAAFGTSECRYKDGDIVEYTGTFRGDHTSAAYGTARFLHLSRITETEIKPEIHSDGVVVTVSRARGDRIERFTEFAHKHGLIDPHPEKAPLAYTPIPDADAIALINKMGWHQVDSGYPGPQGAAQCFMVTTTKNPEAAFQVAHYLKEVGFITEKTFHNINHEILYYRTQQQPLPEMRIAVGGEHFQGFTRSFPKAGCLPAITREERQWVAQMNNAAASPTRPDFK